MEPFSSTETSQLLERGEETTEQQQIVEFHELGEKEEHIIPTPDAPQEYLRPAQDDQVNSVIGFLSRPIQLTRFQWNSSSSYFSDVAVIDLPYDWTGRSMIAEKLQGFRYLRCDFKIRVQVNAQPFNAGRLIIFFAPISNALYELPSSMSHFGGITGYPHVDLDLGEATIAELTVPFSINMSHFDLLTGFGGLGRVYVRVYSPLTGSAEADGTVWVTASSIDIQQPLGVQPFAYEQAGGNVSTKEAKKAGRGAGPLEKTASVVSGIAGALSSIPAVGGIASTVGWVADAVGGVASMFGWSAPVVQADTTPVLQKYAHTMTTFNGVVNAKPLALDSRNTIRTPDHLRRTNVDEMTISYLVSQPTYCSRFQMKESDVQGRILWVWPVHPRSCQKQQVAAPGALRRYNLNSKLAFITSTAELWRGTIVYDFHLVKTRFHSGRIRVSYVTGVNETYNFSQVDTSKIYSEIYDLLDVTQFSFSVPFIWNNEWAPAEDYGRVDDLSICPSIPTGCIVVDVINSLKRPDTAADQFDVLVEVRAGEDFELAVPTLSPRESIEYAFIPPATQVTRAKPALMSLNPSGVDRNYAAMKTKIKPHPTPVAQKTETSVLGATPIQPVKKAAVPPSDPLDEPHPNSRSGMSKREWMRYDDVTRILVDRGRQAKKEGWPLYPGNADMIPSVSQGHGNYIYTAAQKTTMWNNYKHTYGSLDNASLESHKRYFDAWYLTQYAEEQAGNIRSDSATTIPAEMGIGEKYVSLRQFIKRKELMGQYIVPPPAADNKAVYFFPFSTNWTTGAVVPTDVFSGPIDWVESLFRWQTGGMHVMFTTPRGILPSKALSACKIHTGFNSAEAPDGALAKLTNFGNYQDGGALVTFWQDPEVAPEISVPFYQPYPAIPTHVGRPAVADYNRNVNLRGLVPYNYGTQVEMILANETIIWRSAADDFSFIFDIGPPVSYIQDAEAYKIKHTLKKLDLSTE